MHKLLQQQGPEKLKTNILEYEEANTKQEQDSIVYISNNKYL